MSYESICRVWSFLIWLFSHVIKWKTHPYCFCISIVYSLFKKQKSKLFLDPDLFFFLIQDPFPDPALQSVTLSPSSPLVWDNFWVIPCFHGLGTLDEVWSAAPWHVLPRVWCLLVIRLGLWAWKKAAKPRALSLASGPGLQGASLLHSLPGGLDHLVHVKGDRFLQGIVPEFFACTPERFFHKLTKHVMLFHTSAPAP